MSTSGWRRARGLTAADAELPPNVQVEPGTLILGGSFNEYASDAPIGLSIGRNCTIDGVRFKVGAHGRVIIGDRCYITGAALLCEREIRIGDDVAIGWNVTIADTDFHPVSTAERIDDAVAHSPLGLGRPVPPYPELPVVIEDGVLIRPNAAILKGVNIGAGAVIEAGSIVTTDVRSGEQVSGNPAMPVKGPSR